MHIDYNTLHQQVKVITHRQKLAKFNLSGDLTSGPLQVWK